MPESDAELVALPAVRELIAGEVQRLNAELAQYAQIKNFCLLSEEWTADGGQLTPTQKLKRREISKKFAAEIERDLCRSATADGGKAGMTSRKAAKRKRRERAERKQSFLSKCVPNPSLEAVGAMNFYD